jgi:hypothetical protein
LVNALCGKETEVHISVAPKMEAQATEAKKTYTQLLFECQPEKHCKTISFSLPGALTAQPNGPAPVVEGHAVNKSESALKYKFYVSPQDQSQVPEELQDRFVQYVPSSHVRYDFFFNTREPYK